MLILLLSSVTMLGVLATNNIIIFIVMNIIFFALNAIIIPVTQDLVASRSNDTNSSIVMGFYNAIKSLGGIIGALMAGFFYTFNPRLPFIFGFVAFLLATVLSYYYYQQNKLHKSKNIVINVLIFFI